MSITSAVNETQCVINLQANVDISDAADLKQALLDALLSHKKLCLDLTGVTDMDITAVQLLWAAARESRREGISFTVMGAVPEEITSTIRDAGFDAFLESATAPPAQLN